MVNVCHRHGTNPKRADVILPQRGISDHSDHLFPAISTTIRYDSYEALHRSKRHSRAQRKDR